VGSSVGRYYWVKDDDGNIEPIVLTITSLVADNRHCPVGAENEVTDCKTVTNSYPCTLDDPLNGIPLNDTREFFDRLVKMRLAFRIKNTAILEDRSLCYIWDVVVSVALLLCLLVEISHHQFRFIIFDVFFVCRIIFHQFFFSLFIYFFFEFIYLFCV
jgi:hypothetical protein